MNEGNEPIRHSRLPRLRRARLRNIRCFEDAEISFYDQGTELPVPWVLILGDNGAGKSTLLKTLALALASPKEASALFESDNSNEWLRRGASRGSIEVELAVRSEVFSTRVEITRERFGEELHSEPELDFTEWLFAQSWVFCGYGASRRSFGTQSPRGYSFRSAAATLFDPDAPLQNPELSLRRTEDLYRPQVLRSIERVLELEEGSVVLGKEGFEIRGPWGTFLPINSLSDGYRATLAWLLDMFGWAIQVDDLMLDQGLQGVVLVDEIEQHLHPSWQRRILGTLCRQFPGLQFFATTHAPLCVIGSTELVDEAVNIVHLRWEGDSVVAASGLKPPRGRRADQVLTSYLFGLTTTSDDTTKAMIERLSDLLGQREGHSQEEADQVRLLRRELQARLGGKETELEGLVAKHVEAALDETVRQQVRAVLHSGHLESSRYEVRRQLRDLLRQD